MAQDESLRTLIALPALSLAEGPALSATVAAMGRGPDTLYWTRRVRRLERSLFAMQCPGLDQRGASSLPSEEAVGSSVLRGILLKNFIAFAYRYESVSQP
jgi:hypothetical protein